MLASLLTVTSCQNEEIVQGQGTQGQAFTLVASKGVQSRTELKGDQTVWSVGDKIYVSSKDGKTTGVLTLSSEAGLPDGTFTGYVFGNPANLAYSVYPAPASGTTLDLSEIVGGGQLNAPMIGAIDQDADVNVQFNHATGVLYVNLPASNGQDFTITAKNGAETINLAATANVTDIQWTNNVPSLKFTSTSTNIEVTDAKGGIMYIPYITDASDLTNVTFSVENTALNTTGINLTSNSSSYIGKIVRSDILTLTYNNGVYESTTVPEISVENKKITVSAENLQGNSEFINIPAIETEEGEEGEVVENIEVELPKVDEQNQTSVLSFDEIPEGATVTITEDEDSNKDHSIKELTVILPSGDTQVEIDMPGTTVTIVSSDGGELVIEEVIVGTADETFIVTEDVHIKSLTVKRGNVEVYGRVDNIKRHADYETDGSPAMIYVYVIDNGFVGSTGAGVSYASNMNGVVSSADALKEALNIQAGDRAEITLGDNITLSETLAVPEGAYVTLNLNGKTIEYNAASGSVIRSEGNLTLVGQGEIKSTASSYAIRAQSGKLTIDSDDIEIISTFGAISMFNGAEVTINGGSYTATGVSGKSHHCVYVGTGAKLVVNDGTFAHNGAGTSDSGATLTVYAGANGGAIIKGGTFTGSGTYINAFDKYDSDCYLTIEGGTFTNNPKKYVAEGYTAIKKGDLYYVVPGNADDEIAVIASEDDLVALGGTKINGTYMLMTDLNMEGKDMKSMEVSGGATVNFVGNGHVISNLNLTAANIHGMTGSGNEVAGLFDLSAPATTVSLTVSDLTIKEATVSCSGYAATIVGYNPNGGTVITLNNVDVNVATVTAESVAALVGYTTGVVNLTDCDVTNLTLTGEAGRPDKVGAFVGTANTATCAVTTTNCTNNTTYGDYGRVINGANWNK